LWEAPDVVFDHYCKIGASMPAAGTHTFMSDEKIIASKQILLAKQVQWCFILTAASFNGSRFALGVGLHKA